MRMSDLRLIGRYLHRFMERPVFSRQKFSLFKRYVVLFFSLLWEKLRGLDYSMVYYTKDVNPHHSVYTKVPKKILRRIFADVQDKERKAFLDVGCGKGYAVAQAAKSGFRASGGVEYTQILYDICISNLTKENISTDNIYNLDAQAFDKYSDFDVFFFNNPFDHTILNNVAQKIYAMGLVRERTVYYLNLRLPERKAAIEDAGLLLKYILEDEVEPWFGVWVYTTKKLDSEQKESK